ncbi:hypothetical protein HZA73_09540 [candidate division TA06 bacterium]|nr:hypothetical protein [candidate division TA06 bacterium]
MDYNILTTDGNIAFYKSSEVTEIFLYRKGDGAIFNFFTLVVLEEKPFDKTNHHYLCKPIPINDEYSLGIHRYWYTKSDSESNFRSLKSQNKWIFNGASSSQFPQLKYLPKQFIQSGDNNRLNHVLKNNYHNGSYILEFFDEDKTNVAFLLNMKAINELNNLCHKIKQFVPIDLSVVRDRIGNFIFQFPVTILETDCKALPTWDGIQLDISWHPLIQQPPDCLLQVESTMDKIYMGLKIEEYNKTNKQVVNIGNLDQIDQVNIWRREPCLMLSTFSGTFVKEFDFDVGIISHEPRIFEIDGHIENIQITSNDRNRRRTSKANYTNYITNNLYDAEKKHLEKLLSFKQYNKGIANSLNDLRHLIQTKGENGVYLWDPFLSPLDILKTLYFSTSGGVQLLAIGSINDAVKIVYHKKGKDVTDIITEYRRVFNNPQNNNHQLNLEFRVQHTNYGWAFHDRFLIFPSNSSLKRSQVYSLGTSVNSYGQNHHILQEVSHPQPVVDAFNELWSELNHPECIVWKYPKP